MANGINQDFARAIFDVEPTALLELYTLFYDYQNDSKSQINFHGGTNGIGGPIIFDGQQYLPLPMESEGFDVLGDQRLPRPIIRVSNAGLYISSLLRRFENLNGAKIVRKRTFLKFIDDANFPKKVNPWGTANPSARMPDDKYFISRKMGENKLAVEFELVSSLELENIEIPARKISSRYCSWIYRGFGCRYGYNETVTGADRPIGTATDETFVTGSNGVFRLNSNLIPRANNQPHPQKGNVSNTSTTSTSNGCIDPKGLWEADTAYVQGDYVFKYSDRVSEGQGLTSNYYQQHPVYYVCKSGHTSATTTPPEKSPSLWIKDECSKKLFGCKLRFANDDFGGLNNNKDLPYGGFPGTEKYSY